MDEQINTTSEPTTITLDPVVADSPATVPQQTEVVQPTAEVVPATEVAETVTPPEPIPVTPTAQVAGNEPLPASAPEPTPSVGATAEGPQGSLSFSKTDDRQENLVAPQAETPMSTQGSTSQPELAPPPASPMPAQAPVITPPRNLAHLFLEKAKAIIQLRKQKKLLRIMNLFEKKKHITNDEVEKVLHVSDATATRYLSELEKQGKIIQTGKTGHAVTYTKR